MNFITILLMIALLLSTLCESKSHDLKTYNRAQTASIPGLKIATKQYSSQDWLVCICSDGIFLLRILPTAKINYSTRIGRIVVKNDVDKLGEGVYALYSGLPADITYIRQEVYNLINENKRKNFPTFPQQIISTISNNLAQRSSLQGYRGIAVNMILIDLKKKLLFYIDDTGSKVFRHSACSTYDDVLENLYEREEEMKKMNRKFFQSNTDNDVSGIEEDQQALEKSLPITFPWSLSDHVQFFSRVTKESPITIIQAKQWIQPLIKLAQSKGFQTTIMHVDYLGNIQIDK
jgi:hypothetical protein